MAAEDAALPGAGRGRLRRAGKPGGRPLTVQPRSRSSRRAIAMRWTSRRAFIDPLHADLLRHQLQRQFLAHAHGAEGLHGVIEISVAISVP